MNTRKNKNKMKKMWAGVLILSFIATVGTLSFVKGQETKAVTISTTCKKSDECLKAAEEEQAASDKADAASNTASMYQNRVNELSAQISAKQTEISNTETRIKKLTGEIEEKEKKLADEQSALVELLVNMHFEGDAEPITVLAGSTSISDLAEKSARNEVVKQQISATADKVKQAKEQLESDKAEVEELLAQQKIAQSELVAARSEQQNLVVKYENDAAAYEEEAKEALARKIAAEEEYQRTHRDEYVMGSSYSGNNSYPWQGECPGRMDSYYTREKLADGSAGRFIGGYVCECTSYAGWKAYEATNGRVAISWWGNAKSWAASAKAAGFFVAEGIPSAGTIGQSGNPWDAGTGHVFWVESVNADGTVNITEYNNWWSTGQLTGSYHVGDFGAQKISAAEARKYNYIHVQ